MNLGKAHYENREARKAADAFQQAVDLLPNENSARLNHVRALLRAREEGAALEQVKRVLEVERHSAAAHYLSGIVHVRQENARKAIYHLEQASRIDPSVPTVHYQLASAYRLDEQEDRMLAELRTVLELDETHHSTHYQLFLAARNAGDKETMKRHLERYQAITKTLGEADKFEDADEMCRYMEAEVPLAVEQPSLVAPEVRYVNKTVLPETGWRPLALVDVNKDGTPEILLSHANSLQFASRQGSGYETRKLAGFHDNRVIAAHAADYDNDGQIDLLLVTQESVRLLRQVEPEKFADATESAGLSAIEARQASWLEYDHDGDLDILIVTLEGRLRLYENQGNGKFADRSSEVGIPVDLPKINQAVANYMDPDEATDIMLLAENGHVLQLRNDGLGLFTVQDHDQTGIAFCVEDFDNDLRRDILTVKGGHVSLALSGGGVQELGHSLPASVVSALPIDFDNDGWLDLLLFATIAGGSGQHVGELVRNFGAEGWRSMPDESALEMLVSDDHPVIGDYDADGDVDILFESGTSVVVAECQGTGNQRLVKLNLTGTRSNRSGIGTLVEIRAGGFRVARTVNRLPVEIGIGDREQLDSVRTIWSNGIVKNDIWVKTDKPLKVEEPLVSAGSCPYLYAWDGNAFRFVTDILGGSPLGLSLRRGEYVPADTDEYLALGSQETFVPRDGKYVVMIADELRELLYLDHCRLVVVDHPDDTEVHPTDKLRPPPFPLSELASVAHPIKLIRATDNRKRDWTRALQAVDGLRTEPYRLRQPQLRGLAELHDLTLNFGPLDADRPLVLAMTGWLMWGDASVNVAAGQNPDLPNPWPRLEARVNGKWQPVDVVVGAPAGKPKTILVELDGVLPKGADLLRMTSGFEIYWDRIALFERAQVTTAIVELPAVSADLSWRGFPRQVRRGSTDPVEPDPSDMLDAPPWRTTPSGWCTRYGNVLALLQTIDDRFAILNGGDAVTIEFDASTLGPIQHGWRRSFFLYVDGWDKDSDYNVRSGNTVEPLPYHGMDDQAYGQKPWPVLPPWAEQFNTRWVGPWIGGNSATP